MRRILAIMAAYALGMEYDLLEEEPQVCLLQRRFLGTQRSEAYSMATVYDHLQAGTGTEHGANSKGEFLDFGSQGCDLGRGGGMPHGVLKIAVSKEEWFNGYSCGMCVIVDGIQGVGMVTDLCTDCGEGDLALSEFSLFGGGPKDEGRVPVQWQAVPCNPPSWQSMGFVLRDSSTCEVSVALRRARYPVVGLEFWVDKNGRWTWEAGFSYKKDGYFTVKHVKLAFPLKVRLTCGGGSGTIGQQLVDYIPSLENDRLQLGTVQCGEDLGVLTPEPTPAPTAAPTYATPDPTPFPTPFPTHSPVHCVVGEWSCGLIATSRAEAARKSATGRWFRRCTAVRSVLRSGKSRASATRLPARSTARSRTGKIGRLAP
jgi:hypothetical protein